MSFSWQSLSRQFCNGIIVSFKFSSPVSLNKLSCHYLYRAYGASTQYFIDQSAGNMVSITLATFAFPGRIFLVPILSWVDLAAHTNVFFNPPGCGIECTLLSWCLLINGCASHLCCQDPQSSFTVFFCFFYDLLFLYCYLLLPSWAIFVFMYLDHCEFFTCGQLWFIYRFWHGFTFPV